MLEIDAVNQQNLSVNLQSLKRAAARILADHGVRSGALSLVVVDDPTMHGLNRQHLQHDYPTDVLSFLLERDESHLEGEVIVSADYAAREAEQWDWGSEHELLLYVIHGTLHLVGYDDHGDEDRAEMQAKEREYFQALELPTPPGRQAQSKATALGAVDSPHPEGNSPPAAREDA